MLTPQFIQERDSWVATLPTWQRRLTRDIIEFGHCREEALERALQEFLQMHNLVEGFEAVEDRLQNSPPMAARPAIRTDRPLRLMNISNFRAVSALHDGQHLEVGPGLTVIYGENGAGKSSYVRLLNRAFASRGNTEILPNVFAEGDARQQVPACQFHFDHDGQEEVIRFPAQGDHAHLQRFSVFDGHSARVHLSKENELMFIPGGFECFRQLSEGLNELRNRFQIQISARNSPNPLLRTFQMGSEMDRFVHNISPETTEEEICRLATLTEEERGMIEKLTTKIAELRSRKIDDQLQKLEQLEGNLRQFLLRLERINERLHPGQLQKLLEARKRVHNLERQASQVGAARFAELGVRNADNPHFKDFLIAAAKMVEVEEDTSACPYCESPLDERGLNLRGAYQAFLTSTAERDLRTARRTLADLEKELRAIPFPVLDANQVLYNQLERDDEGKVLAATLVTSVMETLEKFNAFLATVATDGTPVGVPNLIIDTTKITVYQQRLVLEKEILQAADPAKEIQGLNGQLTKLKDRQRLHEHLEVLLSHLKNQRWCAQAETLMRHFATNNITTQGRRFYERYFTDDYLTNFERECDRLRAKLQVTVEQRGVRGKTIRGLKVANQNPRNILSEGEQRAVALADFLTEVNLSGNCCGLIFDDPVTSLDHGRKSLIAKRLAEEANDRQTIIFTHDLVFVAKLKEAVEKHGCEFVSHWITKDETGPGRINLNNGPVNEADYKKSGIAQGYLQRAKGESNPAEKQRLLRQGFAAVRTSYEALIIYDMFNEVYTRFGERISAGRLNEVIVDPEITAQVIDKSGSLSKYIEAHLHSDEYADTKPTLETLKLEIDEFDQLKKRIRELKKERKQEDR